MGDTDVRCDCRCGVCCRELVVVATPADVAREPRLLTVGRAGLWRDGGVVEWVLNPADSARPGEWGPCPFLSDPPGGPAACTIHATRPAVCRAMDCDALRSGFLLEMAEAAVAETRLALTVLRSGTPPAADPA